ncbi:unnamed protein product [Symbiodinium sp. CCMP2592]|nr:unnamed protein product [Symbiodinium sp. CCMP2592]
MKPAWATAVEQALKKDAPALERWTEIETILQESRKCYRQVLRPGQVLVHPSNRSGLGLNGAQVHKTGAQVQSVGFSSMELKRSVCMEISTDRALSQKAFSFNKRQVDMNGGLLAEVRGDERYMSLACSHFTAFCRACIAACPSDQETVSDNGKLTLQRLSTDSRQEVMNAAQGVARTAGELELAMAMVTRAKLLAEQGLCIDWDVVQADVAATVPDASPQTVAACGLFCRFYAGGTEAPLLKFLHDFSLKYGASKRLGEEFMSTVAGLRFAGQERSHAFARAAMIATNLTATKVVDGVARLLSKSDVSRLCAKGMEDAVKDWEELLARAWAHTQNVTDASARAKAVECFGRLMVRSTLFMCKKEKSGQEGLEHGSLANLLTLYEHEMGGKSAGATPAAATKDGPSDAAPATLENMQDPAFLMKLQGFAEGNLYKGKQKYQDIWPWKLEKIGQSHGSFSLSCPVRWDKKVEVPLSELKKFFDLYSGDAPEVVSDSVDRLPHNTEACSQERLRGEFFELCCEYFLKYSHCEEELTFLKNPTCCLLEGKAKTGKLTIFPFTDQISKVGLKPAAGSVEIPVGSEPNLAPVLLNEKGWKIPILKNTASLKEQQSKRQAEKLKEQSSGLFGGEDSEAALVSVTGSSPRKAAKTRLSRRASREARAEKNVLKVTWMGKEIRVLEAGHVTDVPKVHLDDMALFFEATQNAVLTAESFQTRARQSFPKGTAAKDKVVKIGQGRQAQRTGDDRRYSLVKKAGAKARPLDPLPLQEAEVVKFVPVFAAVWAPVGSPWMGAGLFYEAKSSAMPKHRDQKKKEEDGNKKPEENEKKKEEEENLEEETVASEEEATESEDKEKDPEEEPEEATASKPKEAASEAAARLEKKLATARVAASQAALQSWAEEEQDKEVDEKLKGANEKAADEKKDNKPSDGPKGPSKKCPICRRWIQEHAAARRQHRLSVFHRTWKYIAQGLSKEAAAGRAKRRFQEHWQPGREEESEEESEVPKWELRRDSGNKGHGYGDKGQGYGDKGQGYGYGDVRGGSGPSGAKAHAEAEKGRPEQAKGTKKRKKPGAGETISLIDPEDDKEDRKPVKLLPRSLPAKESPVRDSDHVPMPDKKDPEDPEGGGPESYGKVVTSLFQIACHELRQRY